MIFGSRCTVHLHTSINSLGVRGKNAIVVGKSDEIKEYRVYILKECIVVVSQRVQKVETLNDNQNL